MESETAKNAIWKQPLTLEGIQGWGEPNMNDHLDIRFTEIGDDYLKATMPVDQRTQQPLGLLHGGASVVLAETLGSMAGACCVDMSKQYCVGIEINANHVRGVRSGRVEGTARPIHLGSRTHVWEIKIRDDDGHLVCISRLTLAVLDQ